MVGAETGEQAEGQLKQNKISTLDSTLRVMESHWRAGSKE